MYPGTQGNQWKSAREPSLLPLPPTGVRDHLLETTPCGRTPSPATFTAHAVCCVATQQPSTHTSRSTSQYCITHACKLSVAGCVAALPCWPTDACWVHATTTTTHDGWLVLPPKEASWMLGLWGGCIIIACDATRTASPHSQGLGHHHLTRCVVAGFASPGSFLEASCCWFVYPAV